MLDCRSPAAPDKGTVTTPTGTTFGETATYRCYDGFDLIGAVTSQCQASGAWSGSTPTCVIKGKWSDNTSTRVSCMYEALSSVLASCHTKSCHSLGICRRNIRF